MPIQCVLKRTYLGNNLADDLEEDRRFIKYVQEIKQHYDDFVRYKIW